MKALAGVLLLLNVGLGLWIAGHRTSEDQAPPPWHAQRLQAVPDRNLPSARKPLFSHALAARPPGRSVGRALSGSSPPRTSLKRTSFAEDVSARPSRELKLGSCWELGPLATPRRGRTLLHRLHLKGRVVARMGPPAYRVFLPLGTPWPDAFALKRLGVQGAYTTHGPTGGEVLSLGVFLKKGAALREVRALRARQLLVHVAPFGAPSYYYDKVRLRTVSAAFWRRIGGVRHRPCGDDLSGR